MIKDILFYLLSASAILSTAAVFLQKEPIRAAIAMFAVFFSTGLIYILLGLKFLGAIQIIIYSGAIMSLFIVAITSLSVSSKIDFKIAALKNFFPLLAVSGIAFILISLLSGPDVQWLKQENFSLSDITRALFTRYAFPFEAVSLLIFVAVVTAYSFARRQNER